MCWSCSAPNAIRARLHLRACLRRCPLSPQLPCPCLQSGQDLNQDPLLEDPCELQQLLPQEERVELKELRAMARTRFLLQGNNSSYRSFARPLQDHRFRLRGVLSIVLLLIMVSCFNAPDPWVPPRLSILVGPRPFQIHLHVFARQ